MKTSECEALWPSGSKNYVVRNIIKATGSETHTGACHCSRQSTDGPHKGDGSFCEASLNYATRIQMTAQAFNNSIMYIVANDNRCGREQLQIRQSLTYTLPWVRAGLPGYKLLTLPLQKGKGKDVPVLFNRATRLEGVLEEWRYRVTHSWPRYQMKASGQLHAPAALPPGKEPLVPIG
jgi:hypothetical protein